MRTFSSLLLFFLATLTSFADGVAEPGPIAKWSNYGWGGGTIAMVRNGQDFAAGASTPADYLICNDTPYEGTNNIKEMVAIDTPNKGRGVVFIEPGKDGSGKVTCGCFYRPPNVVFRSPYGPEINVPVLRGTYTAYPVGHGCSADALPVGVPKEIIKAECSRVTEHEPHAPGTGLYAAWQCNVLSGMPRKKKNIRFCVKGEASVVNEIGANYGSGNYVVVDHKLAGKNIVSEEDGQVLDKYSLMPDGCIDFYNIRELYVLVVGSSTTPKTVQLKNADIRVLGMER